MTSTEADRPAKLSFDKALVIVGGGAVDRALLVQLHHDGVAVIAADGGADTCLNAGILPEAIIGDMDSLTSHGQWAEKTKIVKFGEQSTTDFEKSLYATQAPVTIALGMTGKRFDHTLAALDSMARHAHDRHIILVDEQDLALAVSGALAFEVAAGDRVSVHPLHSVRFERSDGLEYPLDGLTLAPGVRTGTSNVALSGSFSIVPAPGEMGVWLMIISKDYLGALVAHYTG